jgi:carboxypeptidase PM20D1
VGAEDLSAAAERLSEAIRFQTISWGEAERLDREAFLGLHALLERSFPRVHASLRREVVNQLSLLYSWPGTDPSQKPILLTDHFDVPVVERCWRGSTLLRWRDRRRFIWGRDPRRRRAAASWRRWRGCSPRVCPGPSTWPSATTIEARRAGATAALRRARDRFEFTDEAGQVAVPGIERPVALIGIAEKGYVNLRVTARAPGGHSSMPPRSTAIGRLALAIQRIEEHPMPARVAGPAALFLDEVGGQMKFPLGMLVENRWLFGPILRWYLARDPATNAMIRTTTAVTMVEGGVKENVLPDSATATVNFRLLPGDTGDDVLAHVREAADDDGVTLELVPETEASPVADPASASFELLRASLAEVMPDVIAAPFLSLGGTDTKHYVGLAENSYRFNALRVGPEDRTRAHGVNERIAVSNYAECIAFNQAVIRRAAR